MIQKFRERRDLMVDGLNSLPGITCKTPQGAFYTFPNIKDTGMTSDQFAKCMISNADVSLVPGTIFGEYGEGYIRLCYANSKENITRAVEKIRYAL